MKDYEKEDIDVDVVRLIAFCPCPGVRGRYGGPDDRHRRYGVGFDFYRFSYAHDPGLAFFYAGMVRRKNVLGTMMHSFFHTLPHKHTVGYMGIHAVFRH